MGAPDKALETRGLSRLADVLFEGRARDLNADGFPDPGGDFWTANTFHTRDVVRQSTIDYMQVIRGGLVLAAVLLDSLKTVIRRRYL